VGATRYTRNDTIRSTYNIKTVDSIFSQASDRFANSLAYHQNPLVRRILEEPYVPNRLVHARPRLVSQ
ncbi:hypothetical protein KR054_004089, partial [Drosophila jambulina]